MSDYILTSNGELYHYGVKGIKWGVTKEQYKSMSSHDRKIQRTTYKVSQRKSEADKRAEYALTKHDGNKTNARLANAGATIGKTFAKGSIGTVSGIGGFMIGGAGLNGLAAVGAGAAASALAAPIAVAAVGAGAIALGAGAVASALRTPRRGLDTDRAIRRK